MPSKRKKLDRKGTEEGKRKSKKLKSSLSCYSCLNSNRPGLWKLIHAYCIWDRGPRNYARTMNGLGSFFPLQPDIDRKMAWLTSKSASQHNSQTQMGSTTLLWERINRVRAMKVKLSEKDTPSFGNVHMMFWGGGGSWKKCGFKGREGGVKKHSGFKGGVTKKILKILQWQHL